MNPSHYPNLELCKKLTEKGFPKTELKIREEDPICKKCNLPSPGKRSCWCEYEKKIWEYDLVCPSVMELLDEIPEWIRYDCTEYQLFITKEKIFYGDEEGIIIQQFGKYNTPNALADCYIWLVNNNYITPNKK